MILCLVQQAHWAAGCLYLNWMSVRHHPQPKSHQVILTGHAHFLTQYWKLRPLACHSVGNNCSLCKEK